MAISSFAQLPLPPYYAVMFPSQRTPADGGYAAMSDQMTELAKEQPGYLGVESVRDANGFGITISYWQDLESIAKWRANTEHLSAQATGIKNWYEHYEVRIAKVERAYSKK